VSAPAFASELAGSELDVQKRPDAADCPDAAALTRSVSALGTPSGQPSGSLRIEVVFEREEAAYAATIRSFGRKPGVRRLVTHGKTCEPLADAVSVALAVLLDLIAPPDPAKLTPSFPATREAEPQPPFVLTAGLRAGVSYGVLASGISGVFSGTLRLSRERFELLGSGFWSTRRSETFGPGSVKLGLWGGGLDACFRLGSSSLARVGFLPCAGLRLGRLSGEGTDFDRNYKGTQNWVALSASGSARLPLTRRWAFIAGLSAIVPLGRHTFSVSNPAADFSSAAETGPVGVLVEMGPEATIW
jgi:hypothetical protein